MTLVERERTKEKLRARKNPMEKWFAEHTQRKKMASEREIKINKSSGKERVRERLMGVRERN